jgi:hypothetical protein
VERVKPPSTGDERTSVDAWLDFHRATLLWKCRGLTAAQLAERPIATSTLSLLGLVRHMAECERVWFRYRACAEDVTGIYWQEDVPSADIELATPESAEADLEIFAAEIVTVRAAMLGRSLDDAFTFGRDKRDRDVRWVYLHMIEEYARHNGHADLIRELVDGSTGD